MTRAGAKLRAFEVAQLIAERRASGEAWLEFLRVPALSMGIYALEQGADDPQAPHREDEVYLVVSGSATLRVDGSDQPVQRGSVVYVAAGADHRFHSIREDLTALVLFAPAEQA